MATTYTLPAGGALVPISEAGIPGGCMIANTGTNDAGLVPSGSGVPADAWDLAPGDTLTWDDRPLWASSTSGTTVTVDDNSAGALFSAHSVAAAIIAQGLAGDIAAKIAVSGAPTIDNPKVLSGTLTVPTNNPPKPPATGVGTASVDVSGYNSVTAYLAITAPAGAGDDLPQATLQFLNPDGFSSGSAPFTVQGHRTTQIMMSAPVTGNQVQLNLSAPPGYVIGYYLEASYRAIPARAFVVRNDAWAALSGVADGMWDRRATSYYLPVAGGATLSAWPSYASSPTQWSRFVTSPGAAGVDHYLISAVAAGGSWAPLAGDYGVTTGNLLKVDSGLYFGSAQPQLHVTNHNNTAAITATGFLGSLE